MAGFTTFGISGVWGITFRFVLNGSNAVSLPAWVIDPTSIMGQSAQTAYILRFYAGATGLAPNVVVTGNTSAKTFTSLALTIDSGTLAGSNATGYMLVDSKPTLTVGEVLNVAGSGVANAAALITTLPITRGQTARNVSIMPESATIRVNCDGVSAGSNAMTPANFGLPVVPGAMLNLQEWVNMSRLSFVNDSAANNATVNLAVYY